MKADAEGQYDRDTVGRSDSKLTVMVRRNGAAIFRFFVHCRVLIGVVPFVWFLEWFLHTKQKIEP